MKPAARVVWKRVAYAVLLAAWCAAVWRLSDSSDPEDLVGVRLHVPDKLAHAAEYALGAFLAAGALGGERGLPAWVPAVVFCGAWGTLDEIHQSTVPRRDASGYDLAADVVGAAAGAFAYAARPSRARAAGGSGRSAGRAT